MLSFYATTHTIQHSGFKVPLHVLLFHNKKALSLQHIPRCGLQHNDEVREREGKGGEEDKKNSAVALNLNVTKHLQLTVPPYLSQVLCKKCHSHRQVEEARNTGSTRLCSNNNKMSVPSKLCELFRQIVWRLWRDASQHCCEINRTMTTNKNRSNRIFWPLV